GQDHVGDALRIALLPRAGALHRQRAAVVLALGDDGQDLFVREELVRRAAQLPALSVFLAEVGPVAGGRNARDLVRDLVSEGLVVVALRERLVRGRELAQLPEHGDLAGELAFELLEVLLGGRVHTDRLAPHGTVRAGRPGLRERDQLDRVGRDKAHRAGLVDPASAEGPPGLEVG